MKLTSLSGNDKGLYATKIGGRIDPLRNKRTAIDKKALNLLKKGS